MPKEEIPLQIYPGAGHLLLAKIAARLKSAFPGAPTTSGSG
jgi:hypothetical protein